MKLRELVRPQPEIVAAEQPFDPIKEYMKLAGPNASQEVIDVISNARLASSQVEVET